MKGRARRIIVIDGILYKGKEMASLLEFVPIFPETRHAVITAYDALKFPGKLRYVWRGKVSGKSRNEVQ